ncbi:MAG: cytochrome P450 [Actinobacteria bacterium]|nr:cytochrome P450 [Actinomycetota bacterium]
MTTTDSFDPTAFDPFDADYLADPYPLMNAAREFAPAFFNERLGHWIVTRHADIKQILRNPARFSATNANSPLREPCPHAAKALVDGGYGAVPTLANVDPPAHTRVRRLAATAFTNRRIASMEPVIRQLVQDFIRDHGPQGRADLVADLAWSLPAQVLFRVLGLGDENLETVKTGSWNRILFVYGLPDDDTQVDAARGLAEFWTFIEALVHERAESPRDDYISALLAAETKDDGRLTEAEVATVSLNLLFAGHETTTGLLGNGLRRLLEHENAWDRLIEDPSRITNAIEEILRFDSSVIAWRRQTTMDTQIGGVAVPKDARLVLMLGAANRDPEVFENPDDFDIDRPNAREHLSFGHGPHLCLGAPLARLQGRIALEELTAALPELSLDQTCHYEFAPNISFRGPLSLPATWPPTTDHERDVG